MGTWLRRISEKFLLEISTVYRRLDIPFEPVWFPVFYLLRDDATLSLTQIAQQLEITHSAVSQMVTSLRNKGLLVQVPHGGDGRMKQVALSPEGRQLLAQVQPVWAALSEEMSGVWENEATQLQFLDSLRHIEERLNRAQLSDAVIERMHRVGYEIRKISDPTQVPFSTLPDAEADRLGALPFRAQRWGALVSGQLVGAIGITHDPEAGEWMLGHIYIQPEFRRKGLATALIRAAWAECMLPDTQACLVLNDHSMPLVNLLLKAGLTFKIQGNP